MRYCVLRGIVYIAGLVDCDSIALSLLILPLLGTILSARPKCLVHSFIGDVGLLVIALTDLVRGAGLERLNSDLVCLPPVVLFTDDLGAGTNLFSAVSHGDLHLLLDSR